MLHYWWITNKDRLHGCWFCVQRSRLHAPATSRDVIANNNTEWRHRRRQCRVISHLTLERKWFSASPPSSGTPSSCKVSVCPAGSAARAGVSLARSPARWGKDRALGGRGTLLQAPPRCAGRPGGTTTGRYVSARPSTPSTSHQRLAPPHRHRRPATATFTRLGLSSLCNVIRSSDRTGV